MASRILVTGGLGFLGYHLLRRLLHSQPGCELTVVDDLSSTRIDRSWLAGRAEILIGDFRAADLRGRRFDRIYHLASPVGSLGILAKAGHIAHPITELALCAGETAARCGASLLYVSSSEIYGKAGLQKEDDELTVPPATGARMEYSLGKLAGEHLLRNLAKVRGFRLTVVRPFNIMGEHQDARIGFVVPTFFEKALAGEPLPLFYGGVQERCFCHAEDMADGLIAVQERGSAGHVYNLGNPANATSIAALAARIRSLCGSDSPLETVDPGRRFGIHFLEAPAKHPSIAKAKAHTGWEPLLDLEASLRRIHRHYRLGKEGREHADHPHGVADVSDREAATAR